MYEKTSQAWEALENKLKARAKAAFEAMDKEQKRDYADRIKSLGDQYKEKQKQLWGLFEKVTDLAQEMSELTKNIPAYQAKALQLHVNGLAALMRNEIPRIFGITSEDMDKIIRAMEQDRRINARLGTLEGMPYEDYLQTAEWQQRRDQALRDAGNRCQLCNKSKTLNVHHKTYERRGHELPEDLIVLCRDCHAKFHNKLTEAKDQQEDWDF